MTTKRQIIRLMILIAVIGVIFLGGRELYYAKSIHQSNLLAYATFQEIADESEIIVQGTFTKKLGSYRTIENDEIMVYTRWQFEVEKAYKGNPGGELTLKTAGGRVGLTELVVEDTPEITLKKPVVIFISKSDDDYILRFSGMGYYDVERDGQGNEIFVQLLSKETKTFEELATVLQ